MLPIQKHLEDLRRLAAERQKRKPAAATPEAEELPDPVMEQDNSLTELDERNINLSNAIARSAQGLNLVQKRIIALALAKTDTVTNKRIFDNARAGWGIRLTAKEYADTFEIPTKEAYAQLKYGAQSLLKTLWKTIKTTQHGKEITQGQWLHLAKYYEGEGKIDIVFHPIIAPHLLGLKREFISYKLKQTSALRSIYSWRMYECLMSWKTTGRWNVSTEDFIKIMQPPESYRKNFGQISKAIINASIKELYAKSGLVITCKKIKAGTRITDLEFRFYQDPQGSLDLTK